MTGDLSKGIRQAGVLGEFAQVLMTDDPPPKDIDFGKGREEALLETFSL